MTLITTVLAFLLALGPLIIFHELGHGLLGRVHRYEYFNNGATPMSIMNPNTAIGYNQYTLYERQYYVDELFNQYTPTPYWEK